MTNNYNQGTQPSVRASLVRWLFACSTMLLVLFAGSAFSQVCSGLPSSAGTASAVATSICSGSTASLSVAGASADTGVVYQWYSSSSIGGPYTNLELGATDTLYTTGSLTFSTYYVLSVKCSNTGDSVLTNEVAITVLPNLPVSVVLGASSTSVCSGQTVTLTATPVNGGTPSYTFYVNAVSVQSGSLDSYTYTPSNGDVVTVDMNSTAACATGNPASSNSVSITVNALPTTPVITPSGATTFCSGGSVDLTSSYTGGNTWSNAATTDFVTVNSSGNYSVTYTDGNGCSSTSAPVAVTVNTSSATVTPASPGFCTGGSVVLTATSTPAAVSYLWSDASTASTLTVNTAGTYTVTTTDGNGCIASTSVTVVENDIPVVDAITGNPTLCFGTSNLLTASATVTNGTLSYAWSLNGSPLGVTTATYAATAAGSYTVTATSSTGCSATSAPFVVANDASPLAGTYTIGSPASCTQFTSIANFVSQINARGISSSVILNVPAGYTETLTAGLLMTATGTASNTITIQKDGAGANPKLTAFVGTSLASSTTAIDAMWSFSGSDYITIDGIDLLDPTTNTTATTMMEVGYGFYKASATDGASNNTVKNCTITLNRNNSTSATGPRFQGSNGIEVMACTPSAVGTTITVTSASGASSNNKFYSNTIQNVNSGISMTGYAGASPFTLCDFNNDIGGASAGTGNIIRNFGGGTSATNACAAVFMKDQWSSNVSFNTVDNNVGGTGGVNHPNTNRGIFYNGSSIGASATINNNNITIRGGSSTTAIDWAIDCEMAQSGNASGNTISINNNTVSISKTGASSVALTAIWVQSAPATMNVNGNTITNFTYAGTSTSDVAVIRSGLAGIGTLNINNNTIGGVVSTGATGTLFGITSSGAPTVAININNNNFNGINTTGATTKTLTVLSSTAASSTVTASISGNNFQSITHVGSGTLTFINVPTGTPLNQTINGNTFTNLSIASTGSVTFIAHGYTVPAGGTQIISNNAIVTAFNKTGAGGTVLFMTSGSSTVAASNVSHINNNFSNVTVTGATTLTGISSTDGLSTIAYGRTVTGNTFNNWTGGTSAITCMTYSYWGGTNATLSNNTFTNITGQGAITAINIASSGATANPLTISSNTINNLSSTGTGGAVVGISCTNASPTVNINNNTLNTFSTTGATTCTGISIGGGSNTKVFSNKIYNLNANNAGATAIGISITGGTTITTYNNVISELKSSLGSGANVLQGISITGGTTNNVYYNSVYLSGVTGGANFGSSAISVNATPTTINLRNNIFVNATTPLGTGIAAAYRRSSTALTNFSASSNNNLYYAGTPGASRLIMYDGTNSYQTLAAYKTAMATRDQQAISENPPFLSTTGSNSNFLHIDPTVATLIEGGAVNITGITTDYDSQIRSGNAGTTFVGGTPDIGADEGDFTSVIPVVLSATASPATQQCAPIDRTVSANVNAGTTALTAVTLNYSYNGVAQTPITMTGGTTTGTSVWTATLPSGSATAGTIISWSVTATNAGGSNTTNGLIVTDKSPVLTATPSTTTVCPGTPVSLGVSSASGNSIVLNGTNQYVEVPNSSSVSLTGNVTLEAWVRPSGFTSLAGIISKYQSAAGSAYFLRLSSVSPYSGLGIGNASELVSPVGGLTLNNWYHVAAVFNGTAGTIYINGVQVATNATLGAVTQSPDPLRIGVDFFSRYFNGQIDEVRIWNSALSQTTLSAWKNQAVSSSHPNYSSLKAYYNFDETSGTTVIDQSGNGNNGTIVNGAGRAASGVVLAPAGTYSWSPATNLSATNIYNPVCTPTDPLSSTVYTVTLTDDAGCTGTSTLTINTYDVPAAPTSLGSSQCGAGIPSAKVNSTTSGVSYTWYTAPTGGTIVQSSTVDSLTSYSIINSTTFYVSATSIATGCTSARTPVVITVSQPDSIVASASSTTVCPGSTVTLTATNLGTTNSYTYTWNGTGVSSVVGSPISFTAPSVGTYTYTVTGVDGSCTKIASTTITVSAPPTISSVTSNPNTPVCGGSPVVLTATTPMIGSGTATVGTATTLTSATAQPTAFCNRWPSYRMQTLYTAAELSAAGLSAGPITAITYNITTLGDAATNASYYVMMGTTTSTSMTTFESTTGYTTVFPAATYTHAVGLNTITFTTPYIWDGTSNIIIEVGHLGANSTNNSITYYTATAVNTVAYTATSASNTASLSVNRLNLIFSGQALINGAGTLNWSWNGGAGTGNVVTVNPTTTTTYTVTATNPATGCSNTGSVTVNVNPVPTAPTATTSTQCGAGIPTASVSSTSGFTTPQFKWYNAPTGGTLLQGPPANSGPLTTVYTNNFNSSALSGATISGNASTNTLVNAQNALQLTPNVASNLGGITIPASGSNASEYQINFNVYVSAAAGVGADGMSYSFGDDASATSTTINAEYGSGSKLSIGFDNYDAINTANGQGIRLIYGSTVNNPGITVGTNGVLAYSATTPFSSGAWVPVQIYISPSGNLTMTVNSVTVFNNVALPAAFLSANKSNWVHVIKGRTGGVSEIHAIDDLTIQQSGPTAGYTTYNSSINSTTTFYVSEISSLGCEGPRVAVLATVNQPDSVAVTASAASICLGQPVTITATNTGSVNSYSYTWNGTAGSGATTGTPGSSITVTPTTAGVKTYTATAVDGGCTYINSTTVTVNSLPVITSVTPSASVTCAGTPITVTALTPAIGTGSKVVGDSSQTSSTYSDPFYSLWSNKRQQILYTAAELNAAGVFAGNITALEFSVTSGTTALTNFSISLAHTSATNMSSPVTTGYTTVYSAASQAPVIGTNKINFTIPFTWNGTSNVVIQLCSGNPSSTATISNTCKMGATTSFVSQYETHNLSSTDGSVICANGGSAVNTYSVRPTMRLFGQVASFTAGTYNWSWNDGTGVVGTGNVLSVSPTSTTTYTVTAVDPATTCTNTSSTTVVVNPIPSAPTANDSSRCGYGLFTSTVTSTTTTVGPIFKWYVASSGGATIQSSTSTALNNIYVNATTTYYVSEVDPITGCESTRTPVVMTVIQPDAITATSSVTSLCLPNVAVNLNAVQTGSSNTYNYSWSAVPAIGSGLTGQILGPATTLFNSNFTSSTVPSNVTLVGAANIGSGVLQINPNLTSQTGGVVISGGGNAADSISVDFDLIVPQNGADGVSYSYCPDGTAGVDAAMNAENGTGSKLKIGFVSYTNGTSLNGIYAMYNCTTNEQSSSTTGVLAYSSNVSWRGSASPVHVAYTISTTGVLNLSLNGSPVFTNVQLPAAYLAENKSSWNHYFKGRTGAVSEEHSVDNFNVVVAQNQSVPVLGQAISVTPTLPGTYTYYALANDGACNTVSSVTVVANPAAPAINAGIDQTVCVNSNVTLNASGAGLIPNLRFTEIDIQAMLTSGGYNGVLPSWFPAAGNSSGNDLIEITNLGVAPTLPEGVTFEQWLTSGTSPAQTFTVPSGASAMASGSSLFIQWGSPLTNDLVNNYYALGQSSYDQYTSGTAYGYILKKNGVIIDAVGTNGFTFPAAAGVSSSDWSGTIPSNSGLTGVTLIASDNNTASSWAITSTTNPTSYGTLNPGVTANLPSVGNVSWTSIPSGFTSSTANATFGPITGTTQFAVSYSNGTCSSYDTVLVNVITSVPTPVFTASTDTICTSGTATYTLTNAIATGTYQWQTATSATGPWTDISGANTSTYITPVFAPVLGDSVLYFRVFGSCGLVADTSVVKTLYISKPFVTSTVGATRCGAGSVTLTASGYNGVIEWYNASSGGTLVGTGPSLTTSVTASVNYFAGAAVGTCRTATRIPTLVTVNPSTDITASASPTAVCEGQSATVTATSTNPNYVYTWNGIGAGASQTVTPSVFTTYTVFAVDTVNGCGAFTSVSIGVNPIPSVPVITSSATTVCAGSPISLTASSSSPGLATVGTGTTANSTTGQSPFSTLYEGSKIQYLITAAELAASNIVAGQITSIGWDVSSVGTVIPLSNYNIKIGSTSATSLSGYQTGLTGVYSTGSYMPVAGWNSFNFSAPFTWNGTSNIVIEVCHNNDPSGSCSSGSGTCWSSNSTVNATATSFNSVYGSYDDNTAPITTFDPCSGVFDATPTGNGLTSTSRPNMRFNAIVSSSGSSTYNWSTAQVGQTVSVTPAAGTSTYTVTATSAAGCTSAPGSITISTSAMPSPVLSAVDTTICSPSSIDIFTVDNGAFTSGYPAGTTVEWIGYGIIGGIDTTFVNSSAGSTFQSKVILPSGCFSYSNTITVETRAVAVNPVITPAACGNNNGKVKVTITSAPAAPYRYIWTDGTTTIRDVTNSASSDSIYGLGAGTYYLSIYDNEGGSLSCSSLNIPYTVTASTVGTLTMSSTNVSCNGLNDGTVGVTVSGGAFPYTYLWDNGSNPTLASQNTLGGGVYNVLVTDALGCTATGTVTVTEPSAIVATFTVDKPCALGTNGSITATVTGGTGTYATLEWYNQDFSTDLGSGLSVTGLSAGDYNYVVVDDNGCSPVLGPFTVSVIDAPAIVVGTITPSTGAVGSTVTLSGSGFTGATGVSFNGTSATVFSVVDDNTITVTVPTGATDGPITVSVGGCTGVSGGSFTVQNDATFNLKAYMQGYYIGSGAMNSVLMNQGISVDANEMDTVTVQLRDQFDPTVVVATSVAVMNVNGEASFTIPGTVIGGNYYIAVFHRSALQTWSALPVTFAATTSYDFTTSASQAFADNQVEIEPGIFAMYTGDVNQDGTDDGTDYLLIDTDIQNFGAGYVPTDLNGDGTVDGTDYLILDANIQNFIGSVHP